MQSSGTPQANTVATFTGSGRENAPRFTVTSTWKLIYSFSCSNFGQAGNFAVLEDGGNDFNRVTVNDLEISRSASTWAYNDAGTHYLEVDSECAWRSRSSTNRDRRASARIAAGRMFSATARWPLWERVWRAALTRPAFLR